jgi:hypothetical protein
LLANSRHIRTFCFLHLDLLLVYDGPVHFLNCLAGLQHVLELDETVLLFLDGDVLDEPELAEMQDEILLRDRRGEFTLRFDFELPINTRLLVQSTSS